MAADPILIVDDNEANLKVACFALESEGFEVRLAADGEAALKVLRTFRPRLILMDIQLPGIDGLELTRRLKAAPATADILIIAVTAYAMKGDREKALAAGCDGYITKPLDPIELPRQIAEFLRGKRALRTVVPSVAPAVADTAPATEAQNSQFVQQAPILLVEDNPSARKLFRVALESAGYCVAEAADARSALAFIERRTPAMIIQDLILPDMDGLQLAKKFQDLLAVDSVPILCVSGFLSRIEEARAAASGFSQVLVKPVDPIYLIEVVKTHLITPPDSTAGYGEGRRLLIVDDDPLQRKLADVWFTGAGFEVITAENGVAALESATQTLPAAIVSDVLMPTMDGYDLCAAIRRDPRTAHLPVILISAAYVEEADRTLAKHVGANALLMKSVGPETITEALSQALSAPAPVSGNTIAELEHEHVQRTMWQLERQVQQNQRLLQRTSLQEAQLAVLAGVAEALANRQVIDGILGDVLAACLDMAGISKGALYTADKAQCLRLNYQLGFSDAEKAQLRVAYGSETYFAQMARAGRVLAIPPAPIPDELAHQLLHEMGTESLLFVPVTWTGTTFGAMLLGAGSNDIGQDGLAFARVLGAQMGQAMRLAKSFADLVASEQRYRVLTENAHDLIGILTPDGRIREVNRRLAEVLGFSAEEIVGRHIRDFAAIGRENENVENYGKSLAGGSGLTPPVEIRQADGSSALIEFANTAVDVAGDKLVISIGRDITEQIRANTQLMVSDRMASLGTLAAGVAHEINNPLAVVLGNLELAVMDASKLGDGVDNLPTLEKLQESLHDAVDAAHRVRQIVKDLKIFSRAEEELSTSVDVHRVLDSTLRMASNEIRHRAQLVKSYEALRFVYGNEARLGQVFLNLVMNAAQAIPEGRADSNEIRVSTRMDPDGRVMVEVKDSGPGIATDTLKKLFKPFFTTKPAGVGTGLGLAICQRIIHSLGGEITVQSQLGRGSVFRVFLPAAHDEDHAVAQCATPIASAAQRGNIMVVDDDKLVGMLLRKALTDQHQIELCDNAKDALAMLRAGRRFDVILCDMMMPVVSGMEFFQALEEFAPEQCARVLFLTGGAFTAQAREFLDKVPNRRVEKPIGISELRALINERLV